MATAHLLTIEPHAAPPHHPPSEPTLSEPVHLPGDNYLPGPTLFPGELIAGYHAQSSEYNADTWAAYVLKETSKFPTGSVAFSCSGINSGSTGGRYWFGSSYRGGPVDPSAFVPAPPASGITGARAYTVAPHTASSVNAAERPADFTRQLLRTFKGQHALPALQDVTAAQAKITSPLPLENIQADILIGMKKQIERFVFFTIKDATQFKKELGTHVIRLVTPTTSVLPGAPQPPALLNIAFSQSGLNALGNHDNLGDSFFGTGQFADAGSFGDVTSQWDSAFAGTTIHGVFLIASNKHSPIDNLVNWLHEILGTSIEVVTTILGAARPGDQAGHEHFGFLDGISNPVVTDLAPQPLPGQSIIPDGIILLGRDGDPVNTRPSWAQDGSFLVFRKLQQFVPEFNAFLTKNALQNAEGTLPPEQGAELLGARMVGRWRSGAPVDLTPLVDNPTLGADPHNNNNFDFQHFGDSITSDETYCPFSAHIRKVRPRFDLKDTNLANQAIRAGIPFGPEVSTEEKNSGKTSKLRGLAFVEYQSAIGNGFRKQQAIWANVTTFPPQKTEPIGLDPIIGQAGGNAPRQTFGLEPKDATISFSIPQFVTSLGGEYFFSPSISGLKTLAAA